MLVLCLCCAMVASQMQHVVDARQISTSTCVQVHDFVKTVWPQAVNDPQLLPWWSTSSSDQTQCSTPATTMACVYTLCKRNET